MLNRYPRLTLVGAALVILVAGISIFRSLTRVPHHEAIKTYYSEMGLQAVMITEHLPAGSEIVVLVFDGELKMASEKNFRKVYRALEKKGLKILHVERLVFDEEKGWNVFNEGYPYGEYLRVARAYSEADAILSLCGTPYFSGAVEKPEPNSLPDLLVARVGEGNAEQLVNEGWIEAAVVPDETGVSYKVLTR